MIRRLIVIALFGLLAVLLLVLAYVLVQANRRPDMPATVQVPAAATGSPIRVRFAGVATLLFDDGETAWMTDGFFSRPSLSRVAFTRIAPDPAAIDAGLANLGIKAGTTKLAAVVPAHSHYDHAMDSPLVAMRTGAMLLGSESTLQIGRGLGMPEASMRRVRPGDRVPLGKWTLTFIGSAHAPLPTSPPGKPVETIDAPLVPPKHALAWREGQTWALLVEHASGARMLVLGSAGFIPNHLNGIRADTVFLGVGGVGKLPQAYRERWWDEDVKRVGAKRVIPIHWDDFGQPAVDPLPVFPYLIDDVAATLADLTAWSARDGIALKMPPLFTPFAP